MPWAEKVEQTDGKDRGGRELLWMRYAEILKGREGADRGGYKIISNEEKSADDRDDFAAMSHAGVNAAAIGIKRSEEHTSELQSLRHLVCRLLLEKKKHTPRHHDSPEHQQDAGQ